MNMFLIKAALFLSLTLCTSTIALVKKIAPSNKKPFHIKVLLDEKNPKHKTYFSIEAAKGFLIQSPTTPKKIITKSKHVNVLVTDNTIYIPVKSKKSKIKVRVKKVNHKEIEIVPLDGHISINNTSYQGAVTLSVNEHDKKLYIINTVHLDDYLYAVLMAEIYQSWPLEMQKVQAVTSRSYAVHHMKINKKNKKPYDLKRSNFHQTYNGFHEYEHLRKAIEETKNLILTYKKEVALTMFDACCGGSVPAQMDAVDFGKAPYLARKKSMYLLQKLQIILMEAKYFAARFII